MQTNAQTGTTGHTTHVQHPTAPAFTQEAGSGSFFDSEGRSSFFGGLPVQAKLSISPPDDPQEREADMVADTVMRMPEAGSSGIPFSAAPAVAVQRKCAHCDAEEKLQREEESSEEELPLQRKCAHCEEEEKLQPKTNGLLQRKCSQCEEEGKLQRSPYSGASLDSPVVQRKCDDCFIPAPSKEELDDDKEPADEQAKDSDSGESVGEEETVSPKAEAGGPSPATSTFESDLHATKGSGQPMAPDVRENMESRFGQDFSDVRIHNNSRAASMSSSINAQAFTHGPDIYFNQNKYDGGSPVGQRLLAHELTHVVQQTGSSPVQPKIQRAEETKIGNWAHSWIQEGLRGNDKDLITEAGVPGATRFGMKINNAGYADFYKADGHVVSAVQAEIRGAGGDVKDVQYSYKRFMQSGKKAAEMKQNAGKIARGPKLDKNNKWDWSPNFPANFWVGELKPLFFADFPLSKELVGTGVNQKSYYKEGFPKFVEQVHKDIGSPAPPTISGHYLDLEPLIPDAINYKKFDTEHLKTGKGAILKKNTGQRCWVYNVGDGLMVYFLIKDIDPKKDVSVAIADQRKAIDPVLKALHEKKPKMSGLDAKRISNAAPAVPLIQSKAGNRVQKKDNEWDVKAKDWEKKRKDWVNSTAKPKKFLKEKAKGLLKKAKVDKELKLTPPKPMADQIKDVQSIKLWSSYKGRIYGALRFRFGKTLDKLEAMFNKIKERFKKHRDKMSSGVKSKGLFDGWKKEAVNLIVKLGIDIFKKMIGIAFQGFVNCINSIIDSAVGKLEKALDESKEEVLKEIEPECCQFMSFRDKLDEEVKKHEKLIEQFSDAVDTINSWREILDKVEIAVRVGVQVISCGTPPALGCLWGLVAQIGMSAALKLLTRTEYFENNIAKPAAQALMDAIVGDKLHNLMIDLLATTPLKPYMVDIACKRKEKVVGGSGGGMGAIGKGLENINPNDPAIVKIRKEWEAEYKDQMMGDLQQVFEVSKGKMSEEDMQKMVEALKKANKTPDELRKMVEAGRNAKTGKINLLKALENVESGKVPEEKPKEDKPAGEKPKEDKPKGSGDQKGAGEQKDGDKKGGGTEERKIDYDNATRNNAWYESLLGWTPFFFVKKPGLKADSREFADAVYDMQKAVGAHADGIAGAATTMAFYNKNGIKKDNIFEKAEKTLEKEAIDKAEQKVWDAPWPSRAQLTADLTGYDWSSIDTDSGKFTKIDGRAMILLKLESNARVGAYIKFIETEIKGEKVNKWLAIGEFHNLDEIKEGDGWQIVLSPKDKSKTDIAAATAIFIMNKTAKGSFFQWKQQFYGIPIRFE
ncbi:DUF4157 domain-containing protein [Chitinophaga niabensis]|uniref:eCIS core domain-containing protein n=1 Tax=Chitinophaga niabensis TaxID=536979 RepID=UPI0031BBBD53